MPYEILERDGKHCVAKHGGEVLKCYGSKEQATSYLRALYANVEDATTASADPDHRPVGKGNQTSYSGQLVAASPDFQTRFKNSEAEAAKHFSDLQRKYESAFLAQAKKSKAAYTGQGLTAATVEPTGNVSPEIPGGIIDEKAFKDSVKARTAVPRKRMVNEVGVGILGQNMYQEKANQELFATLIETVATVQAENAFLAASDAVHSAILEGLTDGLSVDQTADRIGEVMTEWAPWQAQRQAQTDLISLANGASLTSAQVLGDAGPQYKTWLSAGDERVRPAHRDLNQQTVGISEPWRIEDAELQYPGDPNGPDGLVINCRCTLIYTDTAEPKLAHSEAGGIQEDGRTVMAVAAAGYDESKHPRHTHGPQGGEFRTKFEIALDRVVAGEDPRRVAYEIDANHAETVALYKVAGFKSDGGLPSARLENVKQLSGDIPTTNKVFTATQDGRKVAVKPEIMLSKTQLRDDITPGLDLEREKAAYRISERIKSIDPELGVDVPRYEIANDDSAGGLGKVGVSDWREGKILANSGPGEARFSRKNGALYDHIIGNEDRNWANLIITGPDEIALIDNGLAFPEVDGNYEEHMTWRSVPYDLNDQQVGMLREMWDQRNEITAQDLAGLPPAAQHSFWGRVGRMINTRERGK